MLNNEQIQNNWPKIKSQVLSQWNKLSESEVEQTHGSSNSLGKLVQEKYGANVNFDQEYEKICNKFKSLHLGPKHSEMDMAEKSMDKDRDDQYLSAQFGVTRPIIEKSSSETVGIKDLRRKILDLDEEDFNESEYDGFNNTDRHSADYSGLNYKIETKQNNINKPASDEIQTNQVPSPKDEDITLGRSNSSANTTSHSALASSEAMSRDTKKL
ncbi:MAG: hypothetical protein PHY93_01540 [Bacteriovorax sp.]|nr:hypothetical protein [Bacteriovorax sp.]